MDQLKNIVGEKVKHKSLGIGNVTLLEDSYIYVRFSMNAKEMKFCFPDAFENFLSFEKPELQKHACDLIERKRQKEKMEKEKQAEEKKKAVLSKKLTVDKASAHSKSIAPQSQNLAFKMNYCDGGSSSVSVGFRGLCSDEIIRYNILKAKRSWCSYRECPCSKYLKGEISRSELDSLYPNGFACYESELLSKWTAKAGTELQGLNEGKRRRLPNAQKGSLAVLTTRLPNTDEKDRVIIGVFIIDSLTEGDDMHEGTVACTSKYHLDIKPDEMHKLKFWDYHRNEKNPNMIRWSSGLFRYMKDENAIALLKAIVELKKGTPDQTIAEKILEYFIELHS